ncbi:hypothetical protein [Halobacteriovorax sp. HLS]|uniref:hypothetical protein n=1 Tax=Halobacteriovorax sp. HLS TaxID=2234000 RepID=UPI000FD8CAF6|nr:hypothetical protein [Halobacteriovorax sp. HLS]
MNYLVVAVLLFSTSILALERSDAFIVRAYNDKFKVLSPSKKTSKVSVIVENKTLVKLIGEIVDGNGRVLSMVTIKPGKYKSLELDFSKNSLYYFVPLSPSFQKVILDFGKEAYEIPSKK